MLIWFVIHEALLILNSVLGCLRQSTEPCYLAINTNHYLKFVFYKLFTNTATMFFCVAISFQYKSILEWQKIEDLIWFCYVWNDFATWKNSSSNYLKILPSILKFHSFLYTFGINFYTFWLKGSGYPGARAFAPKKSLSRRKVPLQHTARKRLRRRAHY